MVIYDFLLLILIVAGALSGMALGVFRAGRHLAANGIAWFLTFLIVPRSCMKISKANPNGWNSFRNSISKAFGFVGNGSDLSKNIIAYSFIGIFVFIVIWLAVWFVYKMLKPKIDKSISKEITKLSRWLGFMLGIVNGIVISFILFLLLSGTGFVKEGPVFRILLKLNYMIAGIPFN